jgi:hypothetical protein
LRLDLRFIEKVWGRVGVEPTHEGFAKFGRRLKTIENAPQCRVFLSWFFALLTTILRTTVQTLQLMFWRFISLSDVINQPVLSGAGSVVLANG